MEDSDPDPAGRSDPADGSNRTDGSNWSGESHRSRGSDRTGEWDSATRSDSVRHEAERLVAAALGAVRLAVAGVGAAAGPGSAGSGAAGGSDSASHADSASHSGGGHTGAAECAFCPFCRVIATLRDPDPEFAERLASAAGDFATGLTGLLRLFSTAAAGRPPGGSAGGPPGGSAATAEGASPATAEQVWREATRAVHDSGPVPEWDGPATATDAAAEARSGGTVPPVDAAGCARVPQPSVPSGATDVESVAGDVARRPVPASRASGRVTGATDDDPGRRD